MFKYIVASLALSVFASPCWSVELSEYALVELTHIYDESTIYWPTSPSRFELTEQSFGETRGGWFYSAYSISTPEHGGTHLDAPIHFSESGIAVDMIPLEKLIAPGVLIDVSAKASADRDYRLTIEDVLEFEALHGAIDSGTIVLLRTGWSEFWPDTRAYLGDDTPGAVTRLSFPAYGEEAARFLVEQRGVALLGVDTASIDYGASTDFIVHRVVAASNVAALENLTGLEALPPTGFTVIALPMRIGGGSGAPVRVVALVARD